MDFKVPGEIVQHPLNLRGIGKGRTDAKLPQPGRAEGIARKQPVQIGARDAAIGADRAIRFGDMGKGPAAIRAGGAAHMDLIPLHRHPERPAADPHQTLFGGHHRLDIEEAQSGIAARRAVMPLGVVDSTTEHLVTATDPEDAPASAVMRSQSSLR